MLLHPTAPKPARLWWDWWHPSDKHVTMAVPARVSMEPRSQGAGGAVGTSHSTVWGRCFSHRLLLGHGDWPQCGCQGGTRLGSAALQVPGCPRSSRGRLHQGFAHQHNLGKGSSSSCAQEARGDGGMGAPTWHWLGLPAALFHLALQGMHGSAQPSPAPTDTSRVCAFYEFNDELTTPMVAELELCDNSP